MPDRPRGSNLYRLAITLAVGLMKARVRSLVIDSGSDWPSQRCNAGLGSKSSYWLGPPSMNMKMTFLALGAKCGARGARGPAAVRPSAAKSSASAAMPTPPAALRKKSRRWSVAAMGCFAFTAVPFYMSRRALEPGMPSAPRNFAQPLG